MHKIISILLIIIVWGPPAFRTRSGVDSLNSIIDLPIIIQLIFWGLLTICAVLVFMQRSKNSHEILNLTIFKGSMKWWFLYSILALISTLYSVNWMLTLVRSTQLVILIYVIAYMIEYEIANPAVTNTLILLVRGLEFKFAVSLSFLLIDSSKVIKGGRLGGGEAGDLTVTSAILAVYYLNELINTQTAWQRLRYTILFAASMVVLLLTKTRVSIISTLVCIFILLFIYLKTRWISISITLIGTCILIITGKLSGIVYSIMRGYQSIESLSGRIFIWEFCIKESKNLILHGYGYASGARYYLLNVFKNIELARNPGDAHNAFFESLMDLGWVASGVMVISTLIAFVEIIKLFRNDRCNKKYVVFILMGLILTLLHNITTVGIAGPMDALPIIYTILLVNIQKFIQYH